MPQNPTPPANYGFTLDEESRLLALEDRREFDPAMTAEWLASPNALHRSRMALALARIGTATFVDANGNGERDPGEHQAGGPELMGLVRDPDRNVRETAAFALGEIGDASAIEALFEFATDREDAGVAAEAVEALSKLAPKVPLARYAEFCAPGQRDGIRARAIQFLFRFNSDDASAIAATSLESPSSLFRQAGAYALSRRSYAPARGRLELLAADPGVETRMYAAAALGRIASKDSLPVLLDLLLDAHSWVRTNAAVALGKVAATDPASLDGPTLAHDALRVTALTEDPDSGTRASSIDILGFYARRNAAARDRLIELATTGSRWERELAAGSLARQFGDDDPKLIPGELTSWAKVRVLEATALPLKPVKPGDPVVMRAGAALRSRYAGDADPMVRATAIGSIPPQTINEELSLVRTAMDDPDIIVRANAIDQFAKSKAPDLQQFLAAEERARRDFQDDARLSAINAIAAVDDPKREPFLRSLLTDRDPIVRRIAADLIEEKLKRNRPQYTPLSVSRTPEQYTEIIRWAREPHSATIHMTRGNLELQLLGQDAPITAWNFAELAKKHYFDNTTFMRVVPNFVIQGGDPRNDMNGGPGYAIRDEINMQKYTRAAVGMALSGPDTGGSQFFVTHSSQPHLDGGYTIFARVVSGMNAVVDQTERGDRVESIAIDEKK
jgi:cyclophilin family peptidyl-prolyl cis-trans isomerase/HEAT repeat protein